MLFLLAALYGYAAGQVKPRPTPLGLPVEIPIKPGTTTTPLNGSMPEEAGDVVGRTYTNVLLGLRIEIPENWFMGGPDFERILKQNGYDLSLTAPNNIAISDQAVINKAIKNVTVLLTAFREDRSTKKSALFRVSVEDISAYPQIRDAVDYFDAVRATYRSIKLPPDFVYSETKAEKLGDMQFGFIDTASKAGKKRIYATVRHGQAILFALSYSESADLVTMRQILEKGDLHFTAQ